MPDTQNKNIGNVFRDIYNRALNARLPVSIQGSDALSPTDTAQAKSFDSEASPYGIFNMWNSYKGFNGGPMGWFNGMFNPTNNKRLNNNFKAIEIARQKARAKQWSLPYSDGKHYAFRYDVSNRHHVPTGPIKPLTMFRYMLSDKGRGYAYSNRYLGLITNTLRTLFHEGIPITGHANTLGNSAGGTNHPDNYMFSSAPHGDKGSDWFNEFLYRNGSDAFKYGNIAPGSYYNSIPEITGALNRLKTQSALTITPWTTLKFNMDDPNRKMIRNPDGTVDMQDYIIASGMAKWDADNNRFIPTFKVSSTKDKDGKYSYVLHNNKRGDVYSKAWPDTGIIPKGITADQLRRLQQDSFSLLDPNEQLAIIHQLNRVYYLKDKYRKGTITPQEYKELDRVMTLYPRYAEQANNRPVRSNQMPSYTFNNPTVIG